MSVDPIPAVVETEAEGETARLFGELRATLQVPFVNLIWRHLATIPGGLEWTWALLKPVYMSPVLGQAAITLVAGIRPPRGTLPGCVLEAAGVGADSQHVIRAMLTDYNRANALNFLSLSLASRVLRGMSLPESTAAVSDPAPETASRHKPTLPPLPGLGTLSSPIRTLVFELDQFGRIGPSDAIGSLYRHLAHWPGFLALAHTALLPFQLDGSLRRQQEAVIADAQPVLDDQLRLLLVRRTLSFPETSAERVLAGIDEFTRLMIGRMTVMGTALLALLPDD